MDKIVCNLLQLKLMLQSVTLYLYHTHSYILHIQTIGLKDQSVMENASNPKKNREHYILTNLKFVFKNHKINRE